MDTRLELAQRLIREAPIPDPHRDRLLRDPREAIAEHQAARALRDGQRPNRKTDMIWAARRSVSPSFGAKEQFVESLRIVWSQRHPRNGADPNRLLTLAI